MRLLGMQPVLPAFAGFVPDAFVARHPQVSCPAGHDAHAVHRDKYTTVIT